MTFVVAALIFSPFYDLANQMKLAAHTLIPYGDNFLWTPDQYQLTALSWPGN
jgi:hypothetical protein